MKKMSICSILCIGLTLLVPLLIEAAPQVMKSKTKCISTFMSNLKTEEGIKKKLLTDALNASILEYVNDIAVSSAKEMVNLFNNKYIKEEFSRGIKIKGYPNYRNGLKFGELCITIRTVMLEEHMKKFEPKKINIKHCLKDDTLTISQIKNQVKKQLKLKALYKHDPDLKSINENNLLNKFYEVSYSNAGFVPQTEQYCATMDAYIYPIELSTIKKAKKQSYMFTGFSNAVPISKAENGLLKEYLFATISNKSFERKGSVKNLIQMIEPDNQDKIIEFYLSHLNDLIAKKQQNPVFNASIIMANLDNSTLKQNKLQIRKIFHQLNENSKLWKNTIRQYKSILSRIKE